MMPLSQATPSETLDGCNKPLLAQQPRNLTSAIQANGEVEQQPVESDAFGRTGRAIVGSMLDNEGLIRRPSSSAHTNRCNIVTDVWKSSVSAHLIHPPSFSK